MSFVLWSLWFTVTLLAVRILARKLSSLPAIKLLLLPGVVVAMASRCMAAVAANARIRSVRLPWQAGESVECEDPRLPFLGRLWLGLIPVAAGVTAVLAAREFLVPAPWFEAPLPDMEVSPAAFRSFAAGAASMFAQTAALAGKPEFHSWRVPVLLHASVSILIFTAPDYREWRALLFVLLPALLFFAALRFLELEAGLFTRGWYIQSYYVPVAAEALAFLLVMGLVTLVAAAALGLACGAASGGGEPQPKTEAPPARKSRSLVEA